MELCKRFFIDDCGQGFTAPCCALSGTVEQNQSLIAYEGCSYQTFVKCGGNFENCDIVKEVEGWFDDASN